MSNSKPLIVIFIGADETGKTNIAKELAKQLDISYFKNTREHSSFVAKDFKEEFERTGPLTIKFLQQVHFHNDGIILDRFTPCEYAYAMAYERKTNIDLIREVDKQLGELDAKIIYCYKEYYNKFDDELVKEEDMGKVKSFYERYLITTTCKYLKLDTTDCDLEREIHLIRDFIDR